MRAGGYYLLLTNFIHSPLYYYAAASSIIIIKGPSANEIHSTKCSNNCRCGSLERMWAGDRKQGIYRAWPNGTCAETVLHIGKLNCQKLHNILQTL